MNKDTIMPDGRPLFAWQNELEMLRKTSEMGRKEVEEAIMFRQVLNIAYKHWREPSDFSFHFAATNLDAVANPDFKFNLEKYLKIIQ